MSDWIWVTLAVVVAVAVGTALAYALASGARPARRTGTGGKTRYELDNEVAWNPWPIIVVAVLVGGLVALVVLLS